MNTIKLIEELTNIAGPSGFESQVLNYLRPKLELLCDEVIYDNLGGIFGVKKSKVVNAPKVLFAGHMDEVGFIITKINDNGTLKFHPIGGLWSQTLLAQKVKVINASNKEFIGVINATPIHLLNTNDAAKVFEIDKMVIDCGFIDDEDAKKFVSIGDFVVFETKFERLANNRIMAKAIDDRIGLVAGLELLDYYKDTNLPFDLYIGATVQEEVGLRGAKVAANLINPDLFITFEASPAKDTLKGLGTGDLGKGTLIRIYDRTLITNPRLFNYVKNLAITNNIDYQIYTSPGGTDAGAVSKSNTGVLSLVISIPTRNVHTSNNVADLKDYESSMMLVKSLLNEFDSNLLRRLK